MLFQHDVPIVWQTWTHTLWSAARRPMCARLILYSSSANPYSMECPHVNDLMSLKTGSSVASASAEPHWMVLRKLSPKPQYLTVVNIL